MNPQVAARVARRRFSIARELGHFVLSHRPISFRSSSALPAAVHIRIHLAKSFISEMKNSSLGVYYHKTK